MRRFFSEMSINRVHVLVVALLCGAALLLAGCGGGGSSGTSDSGAVAKVGPTRITQAQLDDFMSASATYYKSQGQTFPATGSPAYQQLQDKALAVLVQRAEYAQKAKALGIVITPKQISDRLDQLKKQPPFNGSEKRYQAALKKEGFTDQQVRNEIIRPSLIVEELYRKAEAGATVTGGEAETYYMQHSEQYATAQTRLVRHILVKTKAEAEKLRKQIVQGADFGKLAKKYSQDPGSKNIGGRMTVTRGTTVPPYDAAVFALKTGQLSQPVYSSTYGWYIIQALKPAKPRQVTPFNKVEGTIKQQLLQQKRSQAISTFLNSVNREYCSGKLSFFKGLKPDPDPCASTK